MSTPRDERNSSVIDEENIKIKDELPQQQSVFIIIIDMEVQVGWSKEVLEQLTVSRW